MLMTRSHRRFGDVMMISTLSDRSPAISNLTPISRRDSRTVLTMRNASPDCFLVGAMLAQ